MKFKNLIINNKTKLALLFSVTLLVGCDNYLDVDTDKDNPKNAPLNYLLTGVELSASTVGDFFNNSGGVLANYTHSMTTREEDDQYGAKADNANMTNDWDAIYLTLTDIETLISQAEESDNSVYLGIGKLYKAYLMSVAVDLWGDVPFTEATKLAEGIRNPKFDNQKEIYDAVFALIDEGKADILRNEGVLKPKSDDLIYGGSTAKWVKFANTFKLKLYNQTRLSSTFDQAGFDALIAENNFFTSNADDFQLMRYNKLSPRNERNLLYRESYESTQFSSYQSPWFYEILKGVNPNIFTGNPDPRMKYYFFNQLIPNQLPIDQGNPTTGNPNADYWDKSTGFFSIRFGSTGPNRDKSAEKSTTYPGIFPCGGRYDDGQGAVVDGSSGTGQAPRRMLTYDEFLYIKAELIAKGKLSGDARSTLESAIRASFAKVDQVVAGTGTTQTVPTLTGKPQVENYITGVLNEYDLASAEKKFEIIMTQKWIGTFGDPLDQYNDYRRTGYPVLADPNSTTKEYQLNNGDAWPLDDSFTTLLNPYQVSFFWPLSEINSNSNAPTQKTPSTYKIFWDN